MQGFLGIALLVEGLLFGFHLKGSALDMRLHLILVLVVFLSALVCFLEIQHPHSFALSTVRAQLVMLQGAWFYQIAAILFKGRVLTCRILRIQSLVNERKHFASGTFVQFEPQSHVRLLLYHLGQTFRLS